MARTRSDETPMTFFSFQDIISCTTGIMVMLTLLLTLELLMRAATQAPGPVPTAIREAIVKAQARRAQLAREIEDGQKTLDLLTRGARITQADVAALESSIADLDKEIAELLNEIAKRMNERDGTQKHIDEIKRRLPEFLARIRALAAEKERRETMAQVRLLRWLQAGKVPLFLECSANECLVATIPRSGPNRDVAQRVQQFTGPDWDRKALAWFTSTRDPTTEYAVLLMKPGAADKRNRMWQTLKRDGFDVGWDVWPADRALIKSRPGGA